MRIIKTFIYVFMAGIIFGVFVWIYFLICPEDYSDYDKRIYYHTKDERIEQSYISTSKNDLESMFDYYKTRASFPGKKAVIKGSSDDFIIVDYEAKVKLLRKINDSTAKVAIYQDGYGENKIKIRGYVPIFLLHDSIPDSLLTE